MAAVGITAALVALGNIATSAGFGASEKQKLDELNRKAQKLQEDVNTAGNLYDNIYYLVAVNLDRVKKALDKLPSDLLKKVTSNIAVGKTSPTDVKAIAILVKLLGPGPSSPSGSHWIPGINPPPKTKGMGQVPPQPPSGQAAAEEQMLELEETLPLIRENSATKPNVPIDSQSGPFESLVPQNGNAIPAEPTVSSFWRTPTLDKVTQGLNVANIVFGVAGLATVIGLGIWTLEKLNKAISDVEKKQTQVTAFLTAMKNVLDEIATAAKVPAGTGYGDLTKMAGTWEKISQNCNSYQKSLYYAIRGYFMKNPTLNKVKTMVTNHSDPGMPFPDNAYPLTKTLADEIKSLFQQKKTDKDIVDFFAKTYSTIGLRCVFDEFFISSVRWV